MSNMMLGYQNNVLGATLTASNATGGLGPDQLQNDQGSPSTAWQCPGTSAALLVDTGNPASVWRALCLARTNLTPAAMLDWRVGTLDAMLYPVRSFGAIGTGSATTYAGTAADEFGVAGRGRVYTNSATASDATNAYAYCDTACVAGTSYTLTGWFRRATGNTTSGFAMVLEWISVGGTHISYGGTISMATIANDPTWHPLTVTATAPTGATLARALFGCFTSDGTTALTFVVGDAALYGNPTYDTGNLIAGVQPGFGQAVRVASVDVVGQACRLDINDPGNPDGFLNIPLIYAGPVIQPKVNMDGNSAPSRTAQSTTAASRAGGVITRTDWTKRTFDLSLSSLKSAEVPGFEDAARFGLGGGNALFIPDPTGSRIGRDAILGQIAPTSGFTFPQQVLASRGWRATITERL